MKLLLLILPFLLLAAPRVDAQDDQERPDSTKVLAELMKANQEEDLTTVETLIKSIIEIGQTAKSADEVDPLAVELARSFKLAKGNWGTLRKVMLALGELRSKKTEGMIKRIATKRKVKEEKQAALQGVAIDALAKYRNPKYVKTLGDLCKSRNLEVAKAAYAGFKHYGTAKGKVRKNCAEILMKRLEAEKPSAGKSGSGNVSGEQQERWQKLSPVVVASMQAVCHYDTINDVENWREWWKEYKGNAKYWKDKKEKKQ